MRRFATCLLLALAACGEPAKQPAAPASSMRVVVDVAPKAVSDPEPRAEALTPAAVRDCVGFPGDLAPDDERKRDFAGEGPTASVVAAGFHGASAERWGFLLLVHRGPSQYRERLDELMARHGNKLPAANVTDLAISDSRKAQLHVVGIMMGGALVWATLPSRKKTYTLTMQLELPLHDAVQKKQDEAPFAWTRRMLDEGGRPGKLADALRCLDGLLWP